jgi:hypothetical protein
MSDLVLAGMDVNFCIAMIQANNLMDSRRPVMFHDYMSDSEASEVLRLAECSTECAEK